MTTKTLHRDTDICANCVFGVQAWEDNTEVVICTSVDSEHCGHLLAFDHYTCEIFKSRDFCGCHKRNQIMKAIIRFIMCDLLNRHWYIPTAYPRWEATGENWVCQRCGNAVKSITELSGTKGKLTF